MGPCPLMPTALLPMDIKSVPVIAEPTLELSSECLPVPLGDLLHSSVNVVESLVENQFQTTFLGPGGHDPTSIRCRNLSTTFSLSMSRYSCRD